MPPVEIAPFLQKTEIISKDFIYRIDVIPLACEYAIKTAIPALGELDSYPVYWFKSDKPLENAILESIATDLLIDPILQTYVLSKPDEPVVPLWGDNITEPTWIIEKQFLPGVTDNLAKTVEKSLNLIFSGRELPLIHIASGEVYWCFKTGILFNDLVKAVEHKLYNPLIQKITAFEYSENTNITARYQFPTVKSFIQQSVETISLNLLDKELAELSKNRHLALSIDELRTIKEYYQNTDVQRSRTLLELPSSPTDVELEIIAQTWSEHCKHKIFSAKINYTDASGSNNPKTLLIDNLFKTYIVEATRRLSNKRKDLLSVFKDNAGIIQWNDDYAICFKVETHNSPSALEPYGGSLTGIVGVNRDILGTGMGAKPLFNTDVFCFAHPEEPHSRRPSMLPPEAIMEGVRKGVEDGGNKSGIPTVNGAIVFDSRYMAKPLVFCGTGGILPLKAANKIGFEKHTQPGDKIVMAGGRVGKDGIHGATFSSEALNQDSPVSAVQIGDPLTQKRMTDFLMDARDQDLITGITDNGAGGLSSSVGEMAQITNGATIYLEEIPLKYQGLAPYEIIVSESQERMTISTRNFEELSLLAEKHDVEISVIGEFHSEGTFNIIDNGKILASLALDFLHKGLPQMNLTATWEQCKTKPFYGEAPHDLSSVLLKLLASPNICSREVIIRQYDHEVQGRSVIKPLMGRLQTAPSDAAVLQPILGQPEGLVVSNGICPQFSDWDTYNMASCAVDEAIRNAVATGANPETIALLDNFCWPDPLPSDRNPDAELKLAQLVRAGKAIYDMALAYETPFISGKDSMKNDFDDGGFRLSIPPTLLVSAIGKMPDINKAISMEFKSSGDQIFMLGKTEAHLGGSEYYRMMGWHSELCPVVDTLTARRIYETLYQCIQNGWIRSCHDLSEGGLAVALAESAIGGIYGADIMLQPLLNAFPDLRLDELLFSESPSRFIISISQSNVENVMKSFEGLPVFNIGEVRNSSLVSICLKDQNIMELELQKLREAWQRSPAACYEGKRENKS